MYQKYFKEELNPVDISFLCNSHISTIIKWFGIHSIRRLPIEREKTRLYRREFIKKYPKLENFIDYMINKNRKYADDLMLNYLYGQKRCINSDIEINNAIQTNGLTIDEEWAHFLAQNHFLVGISLDGPKKIHDLYRIDNQGKGTFQRIIKAINLFDQYHVKYNILTVVTAQVARDIHKIYNFFKDKNFKYLQFIPCLDPLQEEPGVYRFSLTPEKYSYFLKTLFDLWYEDVMSDHLVNIRYFDNLLQLLMGYPPEACGTLGKCNCQFIIEANGGVYPCDFYVVDKWYLGNIKEKSFLELLTSPNSYQFVEMSQNFDSKCNNCPWFFVCRGGCRRWCEPFNDGKPSINILCSAYQDFFQYTLEQFRNIVEKIRRGDFNN